jgi:2-oxoglutarate ferredoxin oxidoreductase subunit delta
MAEKTAKKKKKSRIVVKKEWCKSCAICVEFCPRDVLVMRDGYPEVANIENCILCQMCELRCPDFAIEVFEVD